MTERMNALMDDDDDGAAAATAAAAAQTDAHRVGIPFSSGLAVCRSRHLHERFTGICPISSSHRGSVHRHGAVHRHVPHPNNTRLRARTRTRATATATATTSSTGTGITTTGTDEIPKPPDYRFDDMNDISSAIKAYHLAKDHRQSARRKQATRMISTEW